MLKRVKVNLEAIEAMNYFWQAASEKENVAEKFFHDVGEMPAMTCIYDDEFNAESVRRTLSAIKNREPFTGNKKEKRFWNYNMWMMEDFEYTNSMIQPCKKLNLDDLIEKLQKVEGGDKYEELEVVISPMHMDEYVISDNRLLVNFFRVKPSDFDDRTFIGEKEMKEFIEEKLIELLQK
jgi:hypothetical protein